MARSQETFSKKEKEKKRLKKRQDKLAKREERKANSEGGGLENMMAYVDENGMITDTPPDPNAKKKVIKASSIEIGVPKREAIDTDIEKQCITLDCSMLKEMFPQSQMKMTEEEFLNDFKKYLKMYRGVKNEYQ